MATYNSKDIVFTDAASADRIARVLIQSPSGGGKTFTALKIAQGLADGGAIGVIDSEYNSAAKYRNWPGMPQFKHFLFTGDFHPDRYIKAIEAAVKAGIRVLIFDTLTSEWNGTNGVLDLVQKEEMRGRSSVKWVAPKAEHLKLIEAITASPIHIIATYWMKPATERAPNPQTGKIEVRSIGDQIVGCEEMARIFDLRVELDGEHNMWVQKTRLRGFDGKVFKNPDETIGVKILESLNMAPIEEAPVLSETVEVKPASVTAPSDMPPVQRKSQEPVMTDPYKDLSSTEKKILDNFPDKDYWDKQTYTNFWTAAKAFGYDADLLKHGLQEIGINSLTEIPKSKGDAVKEMLTSEKLDALRQAYASKTGA